MELDSADEEEGDGVEQEEEHFDAVEWAQRARATEEAEHARLHAEWAKENNASYPPDLAVEPEPDTVEQMRLVLEMAEAICRNIAFDQTRDDCPSHSWTRALCRLQSKLSYLAKASMSVSWDGSGFGYLIYNASMIRMRPLHCTDDKELLRACDGRCMVCGRREHTCQWGFDIARMWNREGSKFIIERRKDAASTQRECYEVRPDYDDPSNYFYGRFTVGKTCLRKVHLAFWAQNFLPYLYEWMDEKLAAIATDDPERLKTDEFCLATAEHATFFVKEIETAEYALRTDSATARLPELPLRFQHIWKKWDEAMFVQATDCNPGNGDVELPCQLGRIARSALQYGKNKYKSITGRPVQNSDGEYDDDDEDEEEEDEDEDEDEDDSAYEDDSEPHLRALVRKHGDKDAKDSVSLRTRGRGAKPDALCDDPDEHAADVRRAMKASAKQHKRQRRSGDAAPTQKRKAREVDAGADEEDGDPEDGETGSLSDVGKRKRGRHARVVASDDEGPEDADGHGFSDTDISQAIQHSFATQRTEEQRKWEMATGSAPRRGANNHEASCSSDPTAGHDGANADQDADQPEREDHQSDQGEAPADHDLDEEDKRAEQALAAANRRGVHLVLAIGHDMAAEEMRKEQPNRARAARRQAVSVEFAKRLAVEYGLDMFSEDE